MRRAALLLVGLGTGCGAYGWADRPSASIVERPVIVHTMDVDAHAGADAAGLTRQLVDELRRAGVRSAAWSGAAARRDVVQCDVALTDDEGFGDHSYVSVSTRCRVDGKLVTTREAQAQLALTAGDRNVGRRRAAEAAARIALPAVADDLAKHLAGNP